MKLLLAAVLAAFSPFCFSGTASQGSTFIPFPGSVCMVSVGGNTMNASQLSVIKSVNSAEGPISLIYVGKETLHVVHKDETERQIWQRQLINVIRSHCGGK